MKLLVMRSRTLNLHAKATMELKHSLNPLLLSKRKHTLLKCLPKSNDELEAKHTHTKKALTNVPKWISSALLGNVAINSYNILIKMQACFCPSVAHLDVKLTLSL